MDSVATQPHSDKPKPAIACQICGAVLTSMDRGTYECHGVVWAADSPDWPLAIAGAEDRDEVEELRFWHQRKRAFKGARRRR